MITVTKIFVWEIYKKRNEVINDVPNFVIKYNMTTPCLVSTMWQCRPSTFNSWQLTEEILLKLMPIELPSATWCCKIFHFMAFLFFMMFRKVDLVLLYRMNGPFEYLKLELTQRTNHGSILDGSSSNGPPWNSYSVA